MSFTPEIFTEFAELGLGGIALVLFYKMMTKQQDEHRVDRKKDSELWRKEIHKRSEQTNKILKDVVRVIEQVNESLDQKEK